MRASRFLSVAMIGLIALTGVAGGTPEQDKAEARREFDAGVEADQHRDWAGALDHYLRANDLLEHPFTIYNIATDYEHLLKLREAGVWYRRYLDKATDPNDIAKVRQKLADLEARPGPLTVRSAPAGARAFVDDAPVGVTPVVVQVKGGSHHVAVEHDGQRVERDVRLTYGEPQVLDIPLGAQPSTLLVFGSPAGATIYVDGQPSGTLPSAQVPVSEGSHEVRVVSVGYTPFQQTTIAPPGGITKVPVSLQRGPDDAAAPGTGGFLAGYFLAVGGGYDPGVGAGTARTEIGFSYGRADLAFAISKVGDTEMVAGGGRYSFLVGKVSPYIGAEYMLSPSGVGAYAGLKFELYRTPVAAVSLLVQVGAYHYTPTDDTSDLDGSAASPNGVTAFPITLSVMGVFGRTIGAKPLASAPPAMQVQGAP